MKSEKEINEIFKEALKKLSIDTTIPFKNLVETFSTYKSLYFNQSLLSMNNISREAEILDLEEYIIRDLNYLLYQTDDQVLDDICNSKVSGETQFQLIKKRLAEKYFENNREFQERLFDQGRFGNSLKDVLIFQYGVGVDTSLHGKVNIETYKTYDTELIAGLKAVEVEYLLKALAHDFKSVVDSIDYLSKTSDKSKYFAELMVDRQVNDCFKSLRTSKSPYIFTNQYSETKLSSALNLDKSNRYSVSNSQSTKKVNEMIKSIFRKFTADLQDDGFRFENNLMTLSERLDQAKQQVSNLSLANVKRNNGNNNGFK